jgi:hypothetical protein
MSNLIGNAPNQVPTNADLGTMAFRDLDPYSDNFSNTAVIGIGSTMVMDRILLSSYRTSHYLVQALIGTEVYGGTMLVTHNNSTVSYAYTGNVGNIDVGAGFAAVGSGDYVNFQFTNNYGENTTVFFTRTSLNAR